MKKYESSLGPSFDTNTIGAVITRTNSGDTSYEYKVTADGYDASDSGTSVVVKYGPSSLEAKKTFYFEISYKTVCVYTWGVFEYGGNSIITEYVQGTIPYWTASEENGFDYCGAMEINDLFTTANKGIYNIVNVYTKKQGHGTGTSDVLEWPCDIDFFSSANTWNTNMEGSWIRYKIYCAIYGKNDKLDFNNPPSTPGNNYYISHAKIINSKITSHGGSFSGTVNYANGYSLDGMKYMEVKLLGNLSKDSYSSWQGIEVYCEYGHSSNPGTDTCGKYYVELEILNRIGADCPKMKVNISITF